MKSKISGGYRKQQRDTKPLCPLLDAALALHLFHHSLDAGEADLRAVGVVLAGEDGVFEGKARFACLFHEADGDVLRWVGVFEQVRSDVVEDAVDILDRKSTRLNSSHRLESRMPSSA